MGAKGVMGQRNDFSCDFINILNTSYVIMHSSRPQGVPRCCIIGRPFHPPPRNFHARPKRWTASVGGAQVDWGAVWDNDAGIFNYGFKADTRDVPFAFYMKGVPQIAEWMWQKFYNLSRGEPQMHIWEIPE